MPTIDKRVDAYIAKAGDFAKPILTRIRETVHTACPDCEETLKWGHPTFMYKGIICGMAAFKEHCGLGFWKGALILENGIRADEAWGQGGRLESVADLPPKKVLAGYIKQAMALNEAGTKVPKKAPSKAKAKAPPPPADLIAALKKSKKALATFERFSPSAKKEYVDWIVGAKAEATRERRIAQAVEWMAEGKQRNWKYM